jgi:hypothetical protein
LIVLDLTVLPNACPVTNLPVTVTHLKTVVWTPLSSLGYIFSGAFSFASEVRKRRREGRIGYALSARAIRRVILRRCLAILTLVGGFALLMVDISRAEKENLPPDVSPPGSYAAMGFMLLGGVLFTRVQPLRVAGYRNSWFKIAGCSEKYLRHLPSYPFDDLH